MFDTGGVRLFDGLGWGTFAGSAAGLGASLFDLAGSVATADAMAVGGVLGGTIGAAAAGAGMLIGDIYYNAPTDLSYLGGGSARWVIFMEGVTPLSQWVIFMVEAAINHRQQKEGMRLT